MNIIPNNIQAKEFRYRAECRDQLQHKGDLYVGTGITEEVALDDGTTKNMCKTEPLYRTTDGLVPASDDSNQPTNGMALVIDNSNSTGWKVGQVETAGIKDRAITEAKLSKEYYIKNKSIDFVSDRATGDLPHISWTKLSFAAGRHSTLILQAPIPSTERTTTILNLPVTNSVNVLATKEQVERGEIVAKIAQYASEDTSKGTIEERLTSLGFKEGDFTLTNSDFYWTQSDQSEKNLGQTIKISREGNYCFLPGRLTVTTGTYRAYALFKATTGSVAANTTIGYVPAEFAPETSVSFRTYNHPNSTSGNWYFFTLCGKDTDTPGELKTGSTTSFTAGTKYILAFVDTDDIQSSDSYRKGWYSKAGAPLPTWTATWTGNYRADSLVTMDDGVTDPSGKYSGSARKTLTVAGGYIEDATLETRITYTVDGGAAKTLMLTSSDQLLGSGSITANSVTSSVYVKLTSDDGIIFTTRSKSSQATTKTPSAVMIEITKIEQFKKSNSIK